MKYRTRKHYDQNTWSGQLFSVTLGHNEYRLFVFWNDSNPYTGLWEFQRKPVRYSWQTAPTTVFPKRRKR